jgi:hypothetical protein
MAVVLAAIWTIKLLLMVSLRTYCRKVTFHMVRALIRLQLRNTYVLPTTPPVVPPTMHPIFQPSSQPASQPSFFKKF